MVLNMLPKYDYLRKGAESWPPYLDEFKDIIWSPLDLPIVPNIDIGKFLHWGFTESEKYDTDIITNSGNELKSLKKQAIEALVFSPWRYFWAKHYKSPSEWIGGFDKLFPELVNYCNLYPFDSLSAVLFIVQFPGAKTFIHTDPDEMLGMRFYLHNNTSAGLYFHKRKEYSHCGIPQWDIVNDKLKERDWNNEVDLSHKLYVKLPSKNIPWCITSTKAVHSLDVITELHEMKITCTLYGKPTYIEGNGSSQFNFIKLHDLLYRSVEKYKDYIISYK